MADRRKIVSPDLLVYPTFKEEDGVSYKLDHYDMTENGLVPVYVETAEISDEQAFNIIMGEVE